MNTNMSADQSRSTRHFRADGESFYLTAHVEPPTVQGGIQLSRGYLKTTTDGMTPIVVDEISGTFTAHQVTQDSVKNASQLTFAEYTYVGSGPLECVDIQGTAAGATGYVEDKKCPPESRFRR